MPGTILSAPTKKRIADCHIKSISITNSREGLVYIWQAARLSLVRGEQFDRVATALTERSKELGVYKKGSSKNA